MGTQGTPRPWHCPAASTFYLVINGDFLRCGDVLAQRFKALVLSTVSSWEVASQLELADPRRGLLTLKDRARATKAAAQQLKLEKEVAQRRPWGLRGRGSEADRSALRRPRSPRRAIPGYDWSVAQPLQKATTRPRREERFRAGSRDAEDRRSIVPVSPQRRRMPRTGNIRHPGGGVMCPVQPTVPPEHGWTQTTPGTKHPRLGQRSLLYRG